MLSDLRLAARQLAKRPAFTAVAVLTLALGMGATTAIFSLLDAMLLRRLPVKDPHQLVELVAVYPDDRRANLPSVVYEHVRQATDTFAALIASHGGSASLRTDGDTQRVSSLVVSGNYFRTLGVGAALGRLLVEEDDRPGAAPVAVLSHDLCRRRFGQSADAVGRSVLVNGAPTTIVGVVAPDFVGVDRSSRPDLFLPLSSEPRAVMGLSIVGRLRPGITVAQARSAIAPLYAHGLEAMVPDLVGWPAFDRTRFLSQRVDLLPAAHGTAGLRWRLAEPVKVLGVVVALLLLIACVNVAGLLLARGESRSSETIVRLALGASRGRVMRALLVESVLLALAGGLTGVALAFALHRLLVSLLPLDPSAVLEFRLDHHMLLFTLVVAMAAGVLTGLVPAFRGTRRDLFTGLRNGQGRAGSRPSLSSRVVLVLQTAGVVVLLACAGLFLRTLWKLAAVDAGVDRRHVLVARIDPSQSRLAGTQAGILQDQLVERVRSLPGVTAAAVAANTVFGRDPYVVDVWVDGYRYGPRERHMVFLNEVGPGFFSTIGSRVVAGRELAAQDDGAAPRVVVVNQAFARRYLTPGGYLGRRLGTRGPASNRDYEVVGVVADSKVLTLREAAEPAVFFTLAQREHAGSFTLHVRTAHDAAAWIPGVRREITRFDPGLEVGRIGTVEQSVDATLASERLLAELTTLFAAAALLLGGIGLAGAVAQTVARRTREIGVRMALGAEQRHILRLVLDETFLVVALGLAIGLPAAAAGARWLRALFYGVAPSDPASLGAAAAIVIVASLLAAAVPARRAARVDPMEALRCE